MADLFGIDRRIQSAVDQVTARVGEWLGVPARIRALYAAVQEPVLRTRVASLDANYQATRNLVQQGLDVAQRAQASRSLPPIEQLPMLLSAATALVDVTGETKKLEQAAGAGAVATAPSRRSLLTYTAGVGVLAGVLLWLTRRRRSRRRRRS